MPPVDLHRFIQAGIEQQPDILRKAPQVLRDFFEHLEILRGSTARRSSPGSARSAPTRT